MTTDSPLRSRLRSELLAARKARDTGTATTVRTVLAALENAEAGDVGDAPAAAAWEQAALGVGAADAPRRALTHEDELAVLDAEVAALREAEQAYAEVAPERAASAREAIALLTRLR